jgi:hypothetical protein
LCGKKEAQVGCVRCRRNLCNDCFEKHMLRISADMDEGFSGLNGDPGTDDTIVCEVCGAGVESAKMDDHLFAEHGITM